MGNIDEEINPKCGPYYQRYDQVDRNLYCSCGEPCQYKKKFERIYSIVVLLGMALFAVIIVAVMLSSIAIACDGDDQRVKSVDKTHVIFNNTIIIFSNVSAEFLAETSVFDSNPNATPFGSDHDWETALFILFETGSIPPACEYLRDLYLETAKEFSASLGNTTCSVENVMLTRFVFRELYKEYSKQMHACALIATSATLVLSN